MITKEKGVFIKKFFNNIFSKLFLSRWKKLEESNILLTENHCQNLSCQKVIPGKDCLCLDCQDAITEPKLNGILICEACGTLVSIYRRDIQLIEEVEVPADLPNMKFVKGCTKCKYGLNAKRVKPFFTNKREG